MPDGAGERACCERCPGATGTSTSRISRRRLLKAAVFQQKAGQPVGRPGAGRARGPEIGWDQAEAVRSGTGTGAATPSRVATADDGQAGTGPAGQPIAPAGARGGAGRSGAGAADGADRDGTGSGPGATGSGPGGAGLALPRAVTGRVTDISPHFITIGDPGGEQRFALTADAKAWRGGTLAPSALRPGDEAVLRLRPTRGKIADRVWANIDRVTGQIVSRDGDVLVVDEGATRGEQKVLIPPKVATLIRVRCHNLEPGYLIDLIAVRRNGALEAVSPGAYQPPYAGDEVPRPSPYGGRTPDFISGTATWHAPRDEPHGLLGVSYPAVDPECGCAEARAEATASGPIPPFRNLPFLAVGSMLAVRNDCSGLSRALPVTGCAPLARRFNDRCLTCGTSERGRIAELTLASFVALGGELEQACFNATITIGR